MLELNNGDKNPKITLNEYKQWNNVHVQAQFLTCVWLFAILWTVALQAPLSMGFSRPEYWSGLTFHPLRNLPDPRNKPIISYTAGRFFTCWVIMEAN